MASGRGGGYLLRLARTQRRWSRGERRFAPISVGRPQSAARTFLAVRGVRAQSPRTAAAQPSAAMALKDYALEKGEGLQVWEGRPAREVSWSTPVWVSGGPGGPGSAREARGRVGRWRVGGTRCLGCARGAEVGGKLVTAYGKRSRGRGGWADTPAVSSRRKGRAKGRPGSQGTLSKGSGSATRSPTSLRALRCSERQRRAEARGAGRPAAALRDWPR